MLTRALSQGLFDKPPHFALSRIYGVLAKGVINTLLDPLATIVTVNYAGFQLIPPGLATGTGLSGLDQDRFYPLVQTATLHVGPFSIPFYFGIGGIIEYLKTAPTFTDLFPLVGTGGTGQLLAGGLLVNPSDLYDNLKAEAESEGIMVVDLFTHLGGNPLATIADPTTGAPLGLDDLFVQAELLISAIAAQVPVELAFGTNTAITPTGAVNPLAPTSGFTITTLIT